MDKPSAARMYDYLLGGAHYFPVDREAAERVLAVMPDARRMAWVNRAFLRRAVRFLAIEGIDQFLDIGSGFPTAGCTHEVVHRINPDARVVYVDIDPIAVHLGQAILKDSPVAVAIQANARQPEEILADPEVRRLLDFDRPLGLLLVALLHFVTEDETAGRLVRVFRDALAPGSYAVIAHGSYEGAPRDLIERTEQAMAGAANPSRHRSRAAIAAYFEGLEMVEPGLVHPPLWRPEGPRDLFLDEPARSLVLAGVGRKPEKAALP